MESYQRYLDPRVLNKISRLDLKARLIVEGFVSGLHKSPYHGYSVEFAEHREYVPGDDLRHLDWRVLGRSDRLYIKEYEQETNLRAFILLDTSESMAYKSGEVTKLEYANYVAASLSYLILNQQDAVGLALFDKEVTRFIPSSSSRGHLKLVVSEIDKAKPRKKSGVGPVFHDVAERLKKKGLVIVISDLFDDPKAILSGLRHFRHEKHDVIVFHVMDNYETTFPFQSITLFEGLEEYPELLADPHALREAYLAEIRDYTVELQRGCLQNQIDYCPVTTDQSLEVALSTYLATRLGTRARK
ncbi:MAG: DUF58 domain-containing protein [Planctomycetes bacterium]|nr:DUF58 domain-containing protein [Planctomycetota bacterium]